MKVKVQTESGSIYTVDDVALTARRVGDVPLVGGSGMLDDEFALCTLCPHDIAVGYPMYLDTVRDGVVITTRVVRAEIVE